MTVIESLIVGKQSQETCEDGIVTTDDFIAVIDDPTSKSPIQLNNEVKNGRFCMILVAGYINNMDVNISCEQFSEGITQKIRSIYKNNNIESTLKSRTPYC